MKLSFTLIEVLISAAIIALMAAVSIPQINRSVENNAVSVETQRLVAFLRNAQAITLAGKGAGTGGFQGYRVEIESAANSYKLIERKTSSEIETVTIEKSYLSLEDDLLVDFFPVERQFSPAGDSYITIKNIKTGFAKCAHLNGEAGLIEMVNCP